MIKKADNIFGNINLIETVCGEMVKDNGEDSYSFYLKESEGYIGVFDGCGGIGAKRYAEFENKTGAYIASRLVALAVKKWYMSLNKPFKRLNDRDTSSELKYCIDEMLHKAYINAEASPGLAIKGKLCKSFPTTMSCTLFDFSESNIILCRNIWAGDSRGYGINAEGLFQVTKDDIENDQDAFSNLSNDSKLENVITADGDYRINSYTFEIKSPVIIITTSDGGFAYYSTPMEFEYAVLHALVTAVNQEDWISKLNNYTLQHTSDDYTLLIAAFGFNSFDDLKKFYLPREKYLYEEYISRLNHSDGELIRELWDKYKMNYNKHMYHE